VQSYKNPEMLRMCLNAIKKTVGSDGTVEVLVADGATEEETRMLLREEFPWVRFFPFSRNVGFRALVNKSVAESAGEYILLINADVIVTSGAVETLHAFLKENPTIGMVGPLQKNFNGELQHTCFRFYKPLTILYRRTFLKNFWFARKHLSWFLMKDYDHRMPRDVDWILGSAMMISRKALAAVGPMDQRFFMYMEDVDWCRRFWENGFRIVYNPHALFYHYYGKGSARGGFWGSLLLNRLTWIHIASAFKYFAKYFGKPLPRQE